MTTTTLDDLSGTTLGGRFQLLRQLGRGGMGAVYLAHDLAAPERGAMALKIIKGGLTEDKDAILRFQREAIAVGKLKHPHIVGLIDAGELAGVHFMAMEFVEGRTLRQRVGERGAIPWRESLDVVAQILDGLGAAHEAGVVHRDLKPDNVMLVDGPTTFIKLLDFGVAKQIDAEQMTMTGTGLIVGTPGFIAPEVIVHGVSDDPRSDLYALGVVWFEMVTATQPFQATTPFGLAMAHAQQPPPSPNSIRPFSPLPEPIETLILRLLAKDPHGRPPSARALRDYVLQLIDLADHPPEPAGSTVRTEKDLGAVDATETAFDLRAAMTISGQTAPLWAAQLPPPPPASSTPVTTGEPTGQHAVAELTPLAVAEVAPAGQVVVANTTVPTTTPPSSGRGPMIVAAAALIGVVVLGAIVLLRAPTTTTTTTTTMTTTTPTPPMDAGVAVFVVDGGVSPTSKTPVETTDAGSTPGDDDVRDAGVAVPTGKRPTRKPNTHRPQLLLE